MEYSDKLTTDRRCSGVYMHQSYAIYNFCRECKGWEGDGGVAAEVDSCLESKCPLHTYRTQKQSKKRHHMTFRNQTTLDHREDPKVHVVWFSGANMRSIEHSTREYTRRVAIKTMCKSCRCVSPGERGVVKGCDDTGCHLWPYRTGRLDTGE